MAKDEEAVVRRSIDEVWNGGRLEVVDEIVADGYIGRSSALPQQTLGREGFKRTVSLYRDAFPDLNLQIEAMVSVEEFVTTRWRASGTHRSDLMGLGATGRRSEVTGLNLTRVVEGRLVEEWQEWNEAMMLRQLGVLPERESTQERALLGVSNLRTRVGSLIGR